MNRTVPDTAPAIGAIRVRIPAKVTFDLDRMKATLGALAERLGCGHCVSGADCRFDLNRDFVVRLDGAGAPQLHDAAALAGGVIIIDG